MEIFPQIMLRVTGLPLQYLGEMDWSARAEWKSILEEENQAFQFRYNLFVRKYSLH